MTIYKLNKVLYAVLPNDTLYDNMLQLTDKDHPTVPIRFRACHNPTSSARFFKKIREHGRASPGRWGEYDLDQTEGPFADWKKHEASMMFTKEAAIEWMGAFQWPHEIDVRKAIEKELILPLYQPVLMTKTHTMMHGRIPQDFEQNPQDYMPLIVGTRDKQMETMRQIQEEKALSKPDPIETSHVIIAFQDKRMHDGYRVGELVQERSHSKKERSKGVQTFKHTAAFHCVKGKVGWFWTVKVRELITKDAMLDPDKMEWNRHGNMDELHWDCKDIIAMFNGTVVEDVVSCMQHKSKKQNKANASVLIPTDICEMIKTKLTGRAFQGPELVVFEAMDDTTKNYSGSEECHAVHDESFMSGDGLVGTRIAYAYADANTVVTWFAGKVVACRPTVDGPIEYNVIYDNNDNEWQCLSVDDYGPNFYEGAAGWVALKSIAFRVGDTVYITEKILQVKSLVIDVQQKASRRRARVSNEHMSKKKQKVNVASESVIEGDANVSDHGEVVQVIKRKRDTEPSMKYNGRDARKHKGAESDDNVCDADDSTFADRAKEVVKEKVTDPLELPKEVTHVDATFFGIVEAVKHTNTSSSITVVFVTSVEDGKNEEALFKREIFGTKKRPEGLLLKSNATINDERHYSKASSLKYSRPFQNWMTNETQKGKERETVIGKESDADFSPWAVGLEVVANTNITRRSIRSRFHGPLVEVNKGSKGVIVEVNKENVDEFSVNFGDVEDDYVVSVFRSELGIIDAT
jgi:hypothetical protein